MPHLRHPGGTRRLPPGSRRVLRLRLVDRLPLPAPPEQRSPGRPPRYSDRLFLKALGVLLVRQLHRPGAVLAVLDEPTPEMLQVRALLSQGGGLPCRRTWERRLARLPRTLPAQLGGLGHALVQQLQPWAACGRAVAIDSTVLQARGGVWHATHRAAGVVPPPRIDTEAHWTKSGWQGWVYGWKLHRVRTIASVWIPLAAELTPAIVAANEVAPLLPADLPDQVHFGLGDLHYTAPNVREVGDQAGRSLITPHYGPDPHPADGWRSAACSLRCARPIWRPSTSWSRVPSTCMARCPPQACAPRAVSPWVLYASISSACWPAPRLA